MSNGLASALEQSAKIIRDHQPDMTTARRLINDKMLEARRSQNDDPNKYLRNMEIGFEHALNALYAALPK